MKKYELRQLIREEISDVLNEDISPFEEIVSTLADMARKGEINGDDIKSLNQRLLSARRQMFTAKQAPNRAAATEKGKTTKLWSKLLSQANDATDAALNLDKPSDFAHSFALITNKHRDEALQAKWNEKHDEILTKLASDNGLDSVPDKYKGKNRQWYS